MRAPWRVLWFLTGLLVSGQYLVNRCQRPKKRSPVFASGGYPRWRSRGGASRARRNDPWVGNEARWWGGILRLP